MTLQILLMKIPVVLEKRVLSFKFFNLKKKSLLEVSEQGQHCWDDGH